MLGDIECQRAELGWLLGYAWFLGEAIRDQAAILTFQPRLSRQNIPIKFLVQSLGATLLLSIITQTLYNCGMI
jgi:hypothetical protein